MTITYIDPSGDEHPVQAEVGKHLLDVAHENNIELEGEQFFATKFLLPHFMAAKRFIDISSIIVQFWSGACGGELACSTCHLVFDQDVYDTLPPKSDEEEDMLDLAFELTETWVNPDLMLVVFVFAYFIIHWFNHVFTFFMPLDQTDPGLDVRYVLRRSLMGSKLEYRMMVTENELTITIHMMWNHIGYGCQVFCFFTFF